MKYQLLIVAILFASILGAQTTYQTTTKELFTISGEIYPNSYDDSSRTEPELKTDTLYTQVRLELYQAFERENPTLEEIEFNTGMTTQRFLAILSGHYGFEYGELVKIANLLCMDIVRDKTKGIYWTVPKQDQLFNNQPLPAAYDKY